MIERCDSCGEKFRGGVHVLCDDCAERLRVRMDALLDTLILMGDGSPFQWTIRQMLDYWRDDMYISDGVDVVRAAFDIRQLAKVLLPKVPASGEKSVAEKV